ncbi:hypothetical protein [Motilimonas sp. KMU-193]|uniref:hypothetical protein n=1 Tax=Motilimonas sp. KMU-193 TaxID=3388668 RepID=UPI00396B2D51
MKTPKYMLALVAASTMMTLPLQAAQARENLACSLVDVVACKTDGECLQGSSRDFDIPNLLIVDFKNKQVKAHSEYADDSVSIIKNMEETEEQLILQGVENHKGWTLAIDRETSSLALTSSGEDLSMMMFGSCTQK